MIASTYVHVTSCIYSFLFIVTFIARTRGKARWSRALLRGLVKTISVCIYVHILFFRFSTPWNYTSGTVCKSGVPSGPGTD